MVIIGLMLLYTGCAGISAALSYWLFSRNMKGDNDNGDET